MRDLRIKAVLDDGTGSIICVLDRALTERIIGSTTDELAAQGDKANDIIRSSIIGTPLKVTGNLTRGSLA